MGTVGLMEKQIFFSVVFVEGAGVVTATHWMDRAEWKEGSCSLAAFLPATIFSRASGRER